MTASPADKMAAANSVGRVTSIASIALTALIASDNPNSPPPALRSRPASAADDDGEYEDDECDNENHRLRRRRCHDATAQSFATTATQRTLFRSQPQPTQQQPQQQRQQQQPSFSKSWQSSSSLLSMQQQAASSHDDNPSSLSHPSVIFLNVRSTVNLALRNSGSVVLAILALLLLMDARALREAHRMHDFSPSSSSSSSSSLPSLSMSDGHHVLDKKARSKEKGAETSKSVWDLNFVTTLDIGAKTIKQRGAEVGKTPTNTTRTNSSTRNVGSEKEVAELKSLVASHSSPSSLNQLFANDFAECTGTPRIVLKVFAYRRLASLKRLMTSLRNAHYGDDFGNVTLEFYVEGNPAPPVAEYLRTLQWDAGPTNITFRTEHMGLMNNIVSSWDPSEAKSGGSDDDACEYAIFLEDDVEVSREYYFYVKSMLMDERYRSHPDVVGFSLYTPKWNEVKYPNVDFRFDTDDPLVLMQLPCSWGALFFPGHWRQFRKYFQMRVGQEKGKGNSENVLDVPPIPEESRTNSWQRSWKKYYIEYMYFRGLVMVYPNFFGGRSLSSTHREKGEHTGVNGKRQGIASASGNEESKQGEWKIWDDQAAARFAAHDKLTIPKRYDMRHYIQPLIKKREQLTSKVDFDDLPPLSSLKIYTLFHRRVETITEMKRDATWTLMHAKQQRQQKQDANAKACAVVQGEGFCVLGGGGKGNKRWKKKYLLYEPQNGLTNQILQIQVGIVMAQRLGRTLVLPPVIGEDSSLLDPADVFDLSTIPVSMIHYKDYVKTGAVGRITRVVDRKQKGRYAEGGEEHFFRALGLSVGVDVAGAEASGRVGSGVAPAVPPRVSYADVWPEEQLLETELKALFGGCLDETLAFTNIFLLLGLLNKGTTFVGLPNWSAKVKAAAQKRSASFGKSQWGEEEAGGGKGGGGGNKKKPSTQYSCLHLRRGDFKDFCEHVARKRRSRNAGPYGTPYFSKFSFENCYMDPMDVGRVLRPRMEQGEVLYIATNEVNRTLVEEGLRGLEWRLSEDFADDIDERLLPALDQAFCEDARVLYKNHWSSFSKHMERRRNARSESELPTYTLGFDDLKFG